MRASFVKFVTIGAAALALAAVLMACESEPTAESLRADLQALPWFADYENGRARSEIQEITILLKSGEEFDTELIKRTIDAGWFVNGEDGDPETEPVELGSVWRLVEIASLHPELSAAVVNLAWAFDDDFTDEEQGTIASLLNLASAGEGLSVWVATQGWMVEGVKDEDWLTATNIEFLNFMAGQIDLDFPRLLELVIEGEHDRVRALDRSTLKTLIGYLGTISNRAHLFDEITNAPWFNDGLDDEERVRIIRSSGDDSFDSYFVQSETIDLPLSGEVTIWVALREPTPGYEDLLRFTGEAMMGIERLVGVPFPLSDVVVTDTLELDEQLRSETRYLGRASLHGVEIADGLDAPALRQAVYHAIAVHYFRPKPAPGWLFWGGPEFAVARIDDWFGHNGLENARVQAAEDAQAECHEQGITNLHAANEYDRGLLDSEGLRCRAILGREFLLSLHGIVGDDAMTAILRERYPAAEWLYFPAFVWQGWEYAPATEWLDAESEIYQIVLAHTPPDKRSEVETLYRQKHGGPLEVVGN